MGNGFKNSLYVNETDVFLFTMLKMMVILITGASHTGKTMLAQKYNVKYVMIDDKYKIDIDCYFHQDKENGNAEYFMNDKQENI